MEDRRCSIWKTEGVRYGRAAVFPYRGPSTSKSTETFMRNGQIAHRKYQYLAVDRIEQSSNYVKTLVKENVRSSPAFEN